MLKRHLFVLLAGMVCLPTFAQFRVEVSGVGLTQVPIAIAAFRGDDAAPQKIGAIVQADLERSGQFRAVDTTGVALDETARPDVSTWRQKGADAMVAGSITRLADGRFDVRMRLWDVVRGQDLGGQSYAVVTGDLRLVAHRIADFVYEKLTGDKGIFSTRIAYVTKVAQTYNLWVADADGENAQSALNSAEPIISPSWAPNGTQIAYVSFESRKPTIYVHDVATGKRRLVANFKGSNSAPAWSPDGRKLAATVFTGSHWRRAQAPVAVFCDRHRAYLYCRRQDYLLRQRPWWRTPDLPYADRRWQCGAGHIYRYLQYFARPESGWEVAGLYFAGQWRVQAACDGTFNRRNHRNHRHHSR